MDVDDHAVHCPHEEILQCPNVRGLITARLAGQPLQDAQAQ